MFDSPLTLTGVIATLLGVVFALAAWINSRRRWQAEAQHSPAAPGAAETRAGRRMIVEDEAASQQSVFKKVGPNGQPAGPLQPSSEYIYTWE